MRKKIKVEYTGGKIILRSWREKWNKSEETDKSHTSWSKLQTCYFECAYDFNPGWCLT